MSFVDSVPHRCSFCDAPLAASEHYVVRIDVFADPQMPEMSAEEVHAVDFDEALRQIIEESKHMSEKELAEAVHQRFEYRLCARCRRDFVANPLGKPRKQKIAPN
jgi:hypothetical protein